MDTLCRACSCEAAQQATPHTEIESKDDSSVKVRVWVGTSRIAGKGLFAAQEIKKGTRIIPYIGKEFPRQKPPNTSIRAISTFLPSMTAIILTARP